MALDWIEFDQSEQSLLSSKLIFILSLKRAYGTRYNFSYWIAYDLVN